MTEAPFEPWQRAPLPPHVRRRRHVAAVATIGTVVCAVLVGAVLIALASVPSVLPEPRPLAHDPVPAERITWAVPDHCGISAKTLRALTALPEYGTAGADGSCDWTGRSRDDELDRSLSVQIVAHHAGPGVPGVTDDGNSSVAAAMSALGGGYQGAPPVPVTGLGDEATFSQSGANAERFAIIEFRTGNVTVRTEYRAATFLTHHAPSAGTMKAGVLRAAGEVARALGAPAAPKVAAPPSPPAPVRGPDSLCGVVSPGLRDRLLGEKDAEGEDGTDDPAAAPAPAAKLETRSCEFRTHGRRLDVAITTSTATTVLDGIGREYLRRYLEARAEQPVSRADERWFHALSGLGDQAFGAYVGDASGTGGSASPATVVARAGAALVTVTYGAETPAEDDAGPLGRDEAVDGAYVVALRAVHAVRP